MSCLESLHLPHAIRENINFNRVIKVEVLWQDSLKDQLLWVSCTEYLLSCLCTSTEDNKEYPSQDNMSYMQHDWVAQAHTQVCLMWVSACHQTTRKIFICCLSLHLLLIHPLFCLTSHSVIQTSTEALSVVAVRLIKIISVDNFGDF
jgi:hypothetical protein